MGVAPWDLDTQPLYWRHWITVVMHEDYEAEQKEASQQKQVSLKERAKQKARELYGGRAR
jgi:hypothetical protein